MNQLEVKRGRVELIVDHNGENVTFVHPPEGPDTYQEVGKELLNRGLTLPTAEQVVSLVHSAYNSQESEAQEIQRIMKDRYFWIYNRNLWVPEGVYVVQDPEAIGLNEQLDREDLERRLQDANEVNGVRFSQDGTLRYAPKETYNLGKHTQKSLAKDGFIIASFGSKGAKKVANLSTKFKIKPYVWGVKTPKNPVQRVSALDSDWSIDRGLGVDGSSLGDRFGYSFGV